MKQVQSMVQAISHSAGITPTGMKDLLIRATSAEASGEAKARVKVILDGLCNLPLSEGTKLLNATNKLAKDTTDEKTIKVRVSEAKQVFGACKAFQGFQKGAESMGWSEAVRNAREQLKEAGIRADGSKVLSKEEKAEQMEVNTTAMILAEKLTGTAKEARTEAFIAQAASEAASGANGRIRDDKAKAHAERIVKSEGWEYAETLISYLMEHEPTAIDENGDEMPLKQVQQAQA